MAPFWHGTKARFTKSTVCATPIKTRKSEQIGREQGNRNKSHLPAREALKDQSKTCTNSRSHTLWAILPVQLGLPEKFRKDPGNALRAFPGIPLESTAGIPQTL